MLLPVSFIIAVGVGMLVVDVLKKLYSKDFVFIVGFLKKMAIVGNGPPHLY